jgi:tetratricopeptide (TPR) repeat protein
VAGQALAVGAVISVGTGQACVLVPPGVSVCLDHATDLAVEKLEAGVRRFRLRAGHVVAHLDPQPAGASFGFETPGGAVIAKGTVFSLRTDGSTVTLRVHEGTVLNSQGAETNAYRAPSTARLAQRQPARISDDELSADAHLIELAKYFGDHSRETLLVTAASGSGVLLDGLSLGMAPISALIAPGSYPMEVSKPGFVPIVERLTFEPGSRIVRDYAATAELSTTGGKQATPSAQAPEPREVVALGAGSPSAAMLLEQARTLRASGKYREANGVYQRLLRNHAGSSEARVALVSLGELQLSQLGDARAALRSFDSYLEIGGALRQEASYGRVRALRQLGRQTEARVAIQAFIRSYPNSVQAATLRKEAQ